MGFIKKLIFSFLTLVIISAQCSFAKAINKEIEVQTKDNHIIKATLSYNKTDGKTKYPTVVLLHSLGYSSLNWEKLIPVLNDAGFAVLAVDLRGHGKSVYNSNLQQKSWVYFSPKAYQKFPSDVVTIINEAAKQSKKVSLDNMAIVGADIGANTAILASKSLTKKPKALVLISPTMNFKGLYVPIVLSEIGTIPILSMASNQDKYSIQQEKNISKFSQGAFFVKNYSRGGMGMLMLKSNPTMPYDITKWLMKYL